MVAADALQILCPECSADRVAGERLGRLKAYVPQLGTELIFRAGHSHGRLFALHRRHTPETFTVHVKKMTAALEAGGSPVDVTRGSVTGTRLVLDWCH